MLRISVAADVMRRETFRNLYYHSTRPNQCTKTERCLFSSEEYCALCELYCHHGATLTPWPFCYFHVLRVPTSTKWKFVHHSSHTPRLFSHILDTSQHVFYYRHTLTWRESSVEERNHFPGHGSVGWVGLLYNSGAWYCFFLAGHYCKTLRCPNTSLKPTLVHRVVSRWGMWKKRKICVESLLTS